MLTVEKRPSKRITSVERVQESLMLYSAHGTIRLEPKSSTIIRVSYTLRDIFLDEEKPGVICSDTFADWDFTQTEDEIRLNTDSLSLVINKETASIDYYDSSGRRLLKERSYESKCLEEFDSYKIIDSDNVTLEKVKTPDGVKQVVREAAKTFDKKLYKTRLYLDLEEEEAIYGLGQHEEGNLNLRGKTVYLHQANMKIAIPILLSSLGYGILVDTYSPMIFNDNEFGSYIYTEADIEMDFYFIYGGSMDGVVKGYRYLTGKAAMLPKWAFGYIQSQERYETAEELINTVKEHRRRNIGLDCIVLDWCSWEGNLWGQKTMDRTRFPDPSLMMKEIHDSNAKLLISVWPNMSHECDNYKEFKDKNLLLPASNVYDAYQEEGRRLYWKQANEGLFCHDIDGWWCDSSEPFTPEWNHMGKPEQSTMYHEFYETSSRHISAELTNSYGLYHARAIYEGQRELTNDKRVINLTRSGYTGQQRYGAILWSGDISATWSTFKKQIAAGLNLCASGIPYWTLDIGAFFVKRGTQWFWDGDYDEGTEDLGYRELYTRWYQYGSFLPIFRSHGTDCRREMWNFGEPGEMFYDALHKANRLRYQLMPYIYSMVGRVWKDDYTIHRMLAFDFPEDSRAREIADQFMFGDSLMVCPVITPMYYDKASRLIEGQPKSREVYLPKGSGWYDFWTNEYYEGGQTIRSDAPIDVIPLYVKAGSILPMTEAMNYVDEIADAPIEVRVYTGRDCSFQLYEDEGNSYRYEEGEYAISMMEWDDEKQKLTIGDPIGSYKGMVENREYKTVVISNK
ncbi:MAG: DUF5110 domain-containing protein [Clostridiales bacterium]|nr:DUF5110 domain-containing protein [Clostridiales bacterium]